MTTLIELSSSFGISTTALVILFLIILWEAVWKMIALWKSARNNHLIWFILVAVINSAGILPILYIFLFSKIDIETKPKGKTKPKRIKPKLKKKIPSL